VSDGDAARNQKHSHAGEYAGDVGATKFASVKEDAGALSGTTYNIWEKMARLGTWVSTLAK
jgi:hypothetical protein